MDSIEQLFAEIYAHPEDDQPRRVLADALLAQGDPRGELILFQLEPDKDYHRRAMRLIQAHGLTWLGPLRGMVIPHAYERGFIAAVGLLPGVAIDYDLPCWGTIHTIDVDGLDDREVEALRLTPAMRSLRRLVGLSPEQRVALWIREPERSPLLDLGIHARYEWTDGEDSPDDVYDPVAE